jgi:hypothetical protein
MMQSSNTKLPSNKFHIVLRQTWSRLKLDLFL